MAEDEGGTRVISISIRPRELGLVDRAARSRGLSRSRFLASAGLLAARDVLEDETEEPPETEEAAR